MAGKALVAVKAHAESRRVRLGYQICVRGVCKRTELQVSAVVAYSFQLYGSLKAFLEQRQLDGREPLERRPGTRLSLADTAILLGEADQGQ